MSKFFKNFRNSRIIYPHLFLVLSCMFFLSACSLNSSVEGSFQATVDSLKRQQTQIVETSASFTQTSQELHSNTVTPPPESAKQKELTATPSATIEPWLQITGETFIDLPQSEQETERRIKASKILIFENMSGSREIRYAKEALDEAGYFYLDVGSATGWFKNQLQSNEDWDLIIVAAEARRSFGGEYFDYIHEEVRQGTSTIIEFWDIDDAPLGRIKTLLDDCGIEFQADWYDPDLRSIFWLQPDHPILNNPNQLNNKLREALPLWRGDIGDLMQLSSTNNAGDKDALLLAGTNGLWKEDHGTLAVCMGGRVIFQTFSSHDFSMQDMIALWQNYIYNALKNHHKLTSEDIYIPTTQGQELESDPSAEPDDLLESGDLGSIGEPFDCGPLILNVPKAPNFSADMFEHHAQGEYLILDLEIINKLNQPVQIWDEDYFVSASTQSGDVIYRPDKAATGYLYIEKPVNLSQDIIDPGSSWSTSLAFDVDPEAENMELIVKPGVEGGLQICEARFSLGY
jgi:hypothetical protein